MRKPLPHGIPSWVEDGAVFFITINCLPRGVNQLARPGVAATIESSLRHYRAAGKWWIHHCLLMPDHLHALVSFSRETPMQRTISDWKRFVARKAGVEWQRDFFDHRLRSDESQTEKWHYIRANPVRKGLVAESDAWPYQWSALDLTEEAAGRDSSPSCPPPINSSTQTPSNLTHSSVS